MSNFMKNCPVGAELMQTDGRKKRLDELMVAFHNLLASLIKPNT